MLRKLFTFVYVILITTGSGIAQCSTTINFDVWLSANGTSSQSFELSGNVTSIQFNMDFTASGLEWPADMIFTISSPDGDCIAGEGYSYYPPASCYDIEFPYSWDSSSNGFYTYYMTVPNNTATGSGTWEFSVENAYNWAGNSNYDLEVIINGICEQGGCTDPFACNYDPNAVSSDNNLCEYPDEGYDCNGNCIIDTDGDGICDPFEIPGCQDMAACNYSPSATDEDNSCVFPYPDEDCYGNSLLPTFVNAPIDNIYDCNSVPSMPNVIAQISPYSSQFEQTHNPNGNCYASNETVTVSSSEEYYEGDCPGNYTIKRFFTGTDCMGRQCSHIQTITIIDDEAPSFTSGTAPIEVNCTMNTVFDEVFAFDSCSEPIDYFIGDQSILPGGCSGDYTIIRYVTATDACGNSSTVEQTIIVNDDTAPVWTELLPEQVISESIETEDFGFPTAEDFCGDVDITVSSEIGSGLCPLAIQLTRTFIAVDDCGNMSEPFVQVINESTNLVAQVTETVDASCYESNDGSVSISVDGGSFPYQIEYGNSNPNALSPGTYEATITDNNLCTTSVDFIIHSPPAIQLSLESEAPECSNPNTGVIFASAAGGNGGFEYSYGGYDPNAVSAGNYVVTVTDSNGCTASDQITVDPATVPASGELDGNTEVMMGDSSVYEYDFNPGSSYEWTFSGADSLVVSNIFAISLLWVDGGEGFVCVQETNSTGCVSEMVCLDINVGVGVDEVTHNTLEAFPNPTSGALTIKSDNLTGPQDWMLIDLAGSIVSQGQTSTLNNTTHTLSVSNNATGSYILIIGNQAISVQIEK